MANIPKHYRLFFLYIEPLSALLGAYWAAFRPASYLAFLTSSALARAASHLSFLGTHSHAIAIPETPTLITLYQLANLYVLFALNEHLVLSSTTSLKTWKTLLFCLLVADLGHLATLIPLAMEKGFFTEYLAFWKWNAMEWGSVGFVYAGATMRACFLMGVGMDAGEAKRD